MLRVLILALICLPMLALSDVGANTADTGRSDIADRLGSMQLLIDTNNQERASLKAEIKGSDASQIPQLQQELDKLNNESNRLHAAFEQIAIGSIDIDFLDDAETKFDWKEEITLIVQPIVDNLKALTDKPRKVSFLNARIEHKTRQKKILSNALESIQRAMESVTDEDTDKSLQQVQRTWQRLKRGATSTSLL